MQDSELIKQLKLGNEKAFRQLVEQQKDRVYNTCLGLLHNPQDAEDMAQEVFIQVWNSIGGFEGKAALSTWIYRIAVTKSLELIRYRKSQKRQSFFQSLKQDNDPDVVSGDDFFVHPGVAMEQKERAEVLFRAIDQLPENQKIAFTLHKVEDLSYKEIAEVMETSVSAVESLMHRAKKKLQDLLYEFYQEQSD
ncbi:MAG TPA: RNA polymerase sigma factor [Balneolaceae bacterium]|nr:RNA polymerase sigma factor [Balneolaceae bacterium]